jgi:hypothetical protein
MPNWLRIVLAIATGFVVWWTVATVGNLGLRWLMPGYKEVERSMEFSLGMLLARLALGALASVVAGAVCASIARNVRAANHVLAVLLLALFVPVHIGLWARFPVWYHVVFVGSLAPLVLLGTKLIRVRGTSAAAKDHS